MTALIFDCDGVLADTERDGHRVAFNQAFREFGVPVQWDVEEYASMLRIGGGKERLMSLLTPDFVATAGLSTAPDTQRLTVGEWHRRKTQIYTDLVRAGRLPARPGVARLAAEAVESGWKVAVASTSAEESVRAVLEHVVGEQLARHFLIVAGDAVANKKPAPDVYELTLERLQIGASEAVAIEDSRNGLLAAAGTGLACVVTVSGYTADEDFTEAALVVSCLGDPSGEPAHVIANRSAADPGRSITLADLQACLSLMPPSASAPEES
jgi:HAD superfamily hydrolase (TIGR01509 family)